MQLKAFLEAIFPVMKTISLLLLVLPAAVYSSPINPAGTVGVAVFDFKSEGHVDSELGVTDAGKVFAIMLADDLSVLAPITVVDRGAIVRELGDRRINVGDPITPMDAKQLGQSLGATALVNGQIFTSKTEVIIAAKVVSADTGQTFGTMVKTDRLTPMADLISQLSAQIGEIVLVQQRVGTTRWNPAMITGTDRSVTITGTNIPHDEVACVLAIDGRTVSGGSEQWSQERRLLPGLHEIVIGYTAQLRASVAPGGSFPVYAARDVVFKAKPGASYEVVYESSPLGEQRQTHGPMLWIKDQASNQPVTILVDAGTGPARTETTFYRGFFDTG